jgi:hypothetical protein
VLRWACPFLLIAAIVTSIALVGQPVYRVALTLQALFYTACVLGALIPASNRAGRLLRVFPLFAGMNLALLVGFWRWLRGSNSGIWTRTSRMTMSTPLHASRKAA